MTISGSTSMRSGPRCAHHAQHQRLRLEHVATEAQRFTYQLDGAAILDALRGVVGLPRVRVEDGPAVAEALRLVGAGMDFADALHVASGRETAQFATFDKRLKKCAETTRRYGA